MAQKKDRAKKSVMESIDSEAKYGIHRSDATGEDVLSNVVESTMEQGGDSLRHGIYTSALHAIEELKYIERHQPSLEKYAQKMLDKSRQGDD